MPLPDDLIPQAIGILAMLLGVLSYQLRTQRAIVVLQFFASLLFAVHFYLLGAISGALLNLLCVFRAAVYARRDRCAWAAHPAWVYVFTALSFGMYAAVFLLFRMEPTVENLLLELLPIVGTFATTVSFRMEKASRVRAFTAAGCPLWLTYNIFRRSLGGALTETFTLVSILIGVLRLDRPKRTAGEQDERSKIL